MSRQSHSERRAATAVALILFVSGESFAQLSTGIVQKLDRFHERTFMKLNNTANHFDQVVGGHGTFEGSETNSEFRLTLYTQVDSGSVNKFSVEPHFSMDLNLPRIEKRFHVFVNNLAPDELPGSSPLNQKRNPYLGLRQSFDWARSLGLDTSAGVRWRLPPVLFGQAQLKRPVERGKWVFDPRQTFLWLSNDDGFGEKTSLTVEYWQNPRTFARSASGARWTESSLGVEWSHALSAGYILKGDRENTITSIGARFSVGGHKSGSGLMDSYRADIIWRSPIYKDWLFYLINPEVTWENSHDWEPTHTFIVGIDMYFSGSSE